MRNKDEAILQRQCEDILALLKIKYIHLVTFVRRRCVCGRWMNIAVEKNKGVNDLLIFCNNRTLFVELKAKKGKLMKEQEEWRDGLPEMHRGNYYVIRNADDFMALVKKRGK